MEFYGLIEEWPGESFVVFRELPGCFSTAPTTEEAVRLAPEAISEYLRWLKQNDIPMLEEEVNSINVVVKERLRGDQVVPRFEADLPAPTDREIDNALNVAATARAQIIELYDEVLPAQRSMALKPDEWSLTEHLRHILVTEARYIACLSDQPPETIPAVAEADLTRKLFENAMDYETFLRDLTPEQRARVYHHGEAEYTAAKVLRRMCEHLREHYPWMQGLPFGPVSLHNLSPLYEV
jgi:predicted RNase H-like HicB family nuclease